MSAEIIEFAASKSGKRVFVFHESCSVCGMMVKPFIIAGRATNRFRCDGTGTHAPYHWKTGDHDVEMDSVNPGYDIPPAIKRTVANSVPDIIS